jgi:hypothetical protein
VVSSPGDLPREAKHDFGYELVADWRHRKDSAEEYDLAVLGITAGTKVRIETREGQFHEGTVRQRSGGARWWLPIEDDGRIVLEPDGTSIALADIVAVATVPDPKYSHDSGPPDRPESDRHH